MLGIFSSRNKLSFMTSRACHSCLKFKATLIVLDVAWGGKYVYIFLTDVCCNEKLSQKMWGNPISRILALGRRQVKCRLLLFCQNWGLFEQFFKHLQMRVNNESYILNFLNEFSHFLGKFYSSFLLQSYFFTYHLG